MAWSLDCPASKPHLDKSRVTSSNLHQQPWTLPSSYRPCRLHGTTLRSRKAISNISCAAGPSRTAGAASGRQSAPGAPTYAYTILHQESRTKSQKMTGQVANYGKCFVFFSLQNRHGHVYRTSTTRSSSPPSTTTTSAPRATSGGNCARSRLGARCRHTPSSARPLPSTPRCWPCWCCGWSASRCGTYAGGAGPRRGSGSWPRGGRRRPRTVKRSP